MTCSICPGSAMTAPARGGVSVTSETSSPISLRKSGSRLRTLAPRSTTEGWRTVRRANARSCRVSAAALSAARSTSWRSSLALDPLSSSMIARLA